ncbi:Tyrosine-protein kinase Fps85D [Toxocara canis]|uniref:Tyrosine-protein kinase n=1 Tax=Toxocara canis TaxID=6265 RepID=A0A0B2V9I3_TOXCA|nr:Tyrosine-protein kinase Fps85D [Toxocara canis]
MSVTTEQQIENYTFYHGFVPKEELPHLLQKVGDFLIRIALRTQNNSSLVLSLRTHRENTDQSIRHVLIHYRRGDGGSSQWLIHENQIYASLNELCSDRGVQQVMPRDQSKTMGHETPEGGRKPYIPNHLTGFKVTIHVIKTSILLQGIGRQPWEVHNDSVTVEKIVERFSGGFVSEGRISVDGASRAVIVKGVDVPVSNSGIIETKEEIRAIANAARILSEFEHTNVLKAYGVAMLREPVLFITETFANASTLYLTLRKRRGDIPDMEKLENMCLACARAIEYIHSKNCIHRCIAARSVLYTEEKLAKLCEFGLARTGDAYILKKSLRVPLKWTAPESLAACLYTTKSDVFSFSILLFEVFTEGKEPYKGMSSAEVKRMVACGSRMDKPKRCPEEIYALMKSCWEQNPDDRCTMTDAVTRIERFLRSISPSGNRAKSKNKRKMRAEERDVHRSNSEQE